MKVAAILPAAGHGTRMGKGGSERWGSSRKQFMKLRGISILELTVRKFLAVGAVTEVLVAVPGSRVDGVGEQFLRAGIPERVRVLPGGHNRQESVGLCLDEVSSGIGLVAVHDAVRPFVPQEMIREALERAATQRAVILGMPAEETVKQVSGSVVRATLPRERLMLVQTPQVFSLELLRDAFRKARADGFVGTDEASLVEHLNEEVFVMRGSERNIKITRPHHMALAEFYYEEERREAASTQSA